MSSNDGPSILISKVFNGSYLDDPHNIGHEIINFFNADADGDKGCTYYYIPGSGKVERPFQEPGTLVFLVGDGCPNKNNDVVVYAVAEVEEYLGDDEQATSNIRYGGLSVEDIFLNNSYKGESEAEPHLTYKLGIIKEPKSELRLHYAEINESDTGQDGWLHHDDAYKSLFQRQRTCLKRGKAPSVSRDLTNLYNKESLWKPWEPWNLEVEEEEGSLWSLLRRDTDELSYSDVLVYLFKTDPYLARFFILGLFFDFTPDMFYMAWEGELDIRREWKNMDIVISYDHPNLSARFVVENKINAGILIEKGGNETQLDKYVRICEGMEDKRNNYYCLLMPDYRSISDEEKSRKDKGTGCNGRQFATKKYSQLKEILEKYHGVETWEEACCRTAKYELIYDEFLNQIRTLSSSRNNSYKRVMFRRFKEIQSAL